MGYVTVRKATPAGQLERTRRSFEAFVVIEPDPGKPLCEQLGRHLQHVQVIDPRGTSGRIRFGA